MARSKVRGTWSSTNRKPQHWSRVRNNLYRDVVWCLDFDGVDDKVSVAHKSSLAFTTEVTSEFWIKADVLDTYQEIINKVWDGSKHSIRYFPRIESNNDLMVMLYYDDASNSGEQETLANAISDTTTWHHVAITWSSTTANLIFYVDGEVNRTLPSIGSGKTLDTNTGVLTIGGSANYFNGKLAEIRLWNKALHADDIAIHAANAKDITSANTASCTYAANCVAHYPMTEGSGVTLIDASASGNNGTFKGVGEPGWSAK